MASSWAALAGEEGEKSKLHALYIAKDHPCIREDASRGGESLNDASTGSGDDLISHLTLQSILESHLSGLRAL